MSGQARAGRGYGARPNDGCPLVTAMGIPSTTRRPSDGFRVLGMLRRVQSAVASV
ncbi:hypothetical protein [Paraburkholderia phenazinium]|uniref:hypothetical protein n=1 Tax=Paraburkholderia phenazinium TaxID=60549 RepID=UPI001554B3BB|nr:hypothetical protein [Paraburkholderia phenazinium]